MNDQEWSALLVDLWESAEEERAIGYDERMQLLKLALSGKVAETWGLVTQLLIKVGSPDTDARALNSAGLGDAVSGSARTFAKNVVLPHFKRTSSGLPISDDPYVSNPLRKDYISEGGSLDDLLSILESVEDDPTLARPYLCTALAYLARPLQSFLGMTIETQANWGADRAGYSESRTYLVDKVGPAAISAVDPSLHPKGRAGIGTDAEVPWCASFSSSDASATAGVYPVYLFDAPGTAVYLALCLGTEERGLQEIDAEVHRLRSEHSHLFKDLGRAIDLQSSQSGGRPQKYERATVVAIRYEPESLDEASVRADLDRFVKIAIAMEGTSADSSHLERICDAFAMDLRSSHIDFGVRHEELVRRFISSLATKRFLILTGLSGSGKTRLAQAFGEWLGRDQSKIVPVRPDWTSPDYLLGYENELVGSNSGGKIWYAPETLRFILRAAASPLPHLLILDEMNLAHVERYFADVLSGIESNDLVIPDLKEKDGQWILAEGHSLVELPKNLFIVGTVNVDETTYMFSPKVLDRANTIEFRVETSDLGRTERRPHPVQPGDQQLVADFQAISEREIINDNESDHAIWIRRLHELLTGAGREFGHRTYAEMMEFADHYVAAGGADDLAAFDVQVCQKVLPRLHGSKRDIGPLLAKLLEFCHIGPDATVLTTFDRSKAVASDAALKISYEKLARMSDRLDVAHYVSFAE